MHAIAVVANQRHQAVQRAGLDDGVDGLAMRGQNLEHLGCVLRRSVIRVAQHARERLYAASVDNRAAAAGAAEVSGSQVPQHAPSCVRRRVCAAAGGKARRHCASRQKGRRLCFVLCVGVQVMCVQPHAP